MATAKSCFLKLCLLVWESSLPIILLKPCKRWLVFVKAKNQYKIARHPQNITFALMGAWIGFYGLRMLQPTMKVQRLYV